jgi:NADPH:quinone reductase-like Zn-dependent oxidoreductase
MKAFVQNAYGSPDVLEFKEVDKPVVKEDQVLVRTKAAGLNAGDYFFLTGSPWIIRLFAGFPRPKNHILGWDVAGQVEAVGGNVKRFRPGDEVFGLCNGSLAEYACAPEGNFAMKPASLAFARAASIPTAALTALQGLRDVGKVEPGQRVMINGASGGVGTFAVQIAKYLEAEVTGVCSTGNVDMVRSLGADHVVDYTREDFTRSDRRYDLILDNVGNHSFWECRRALTPKGKLLPNTGHAGMGYLIMAFALSIFTRRHARLFMAKASAEDMVLLKDLIEAGTVVPVIDREYPLGETPEALSYIGKGHARGKVVIVF